MNRLTSSALLSISLLAACAWGQRRPIVPEDYYSIKSPGDPQLSPDGKLVAYVVGTIDAKKARHSELWLASTDGSKEPRQITDNPQSSSSPRWSPDGKALAFISTRPTPDGKSAKRQVHLLSLEGGEPRALTNLKNGVSSFSWSPDGTRLLCSSAFGPSDTAGENPDKSDARHITYPTYKVDGQGFIDDRRQHLVVVDVKSGSAKQITEGDDWNDTDAQWSPDGARIAFVSDRTGTYFQDMDHSSPAVWVIPAEGGMPIKVSTEEDSHSPRWSPDGKWIAYYGNKIAGHDAPRLLLVPGSGGQPSKELLNDLDVGAHGLYWADDRRAIFFATKVRGTEHIFRLDVASRKVSPVTSGERFINGWTIDSASGYVAYTSTNFRQPNELFVSKLDGSHERQISHLNDELLSHLELQPAKRVAFRGEDGWEVEGFLVEPLGRQPGRKYPLILTIHGGPSGMFGMTWMMDAQLFAAHGWAVFFANPRASIGYGTKFMQGSELQWGGKIYTDIMSGVDTVLKRNEWIDPDKLGVTGCSFGGYMTNWIISHTTRFKAAVPMCSISNLISDEGTRDFYYGHAADFGGDLYQNFDLYWKYSPLRYAKDVKTPTLILHGEADQRVPMEQPEQWFRALRHFHVPSEFVVFPNESHAGLGGGQPKHVVEVMRWQVYWFERYLDGNRAALPPDAPKKVKAAGAGAGGSN